MPVRRLVHFPYVLVRLRCDACKRAGSYRLARLAVKYGAEILLDDLEFVKARSNTKPHLNLPDISIAGAATVDWGTHVNKKRA
jgi:hypothetical protein